MERLELSKQKLLGPKSSASTNFATSANFILSILVYIYILNDKLRFNSYPKIKMYLSLILGKFEIFLIYVSIYTKKISKLFINVKTVYKTCSFTSQY